MASLLVTGGAGFIGANFVHHWRGRYPADQIVILDALTYAGNLPNLDGILAESTFRFIRGDIRDSGLVRQLIVEHSIDTIVHFAAESHVDRSIVAPDAFVETNIVGTHALLKAASACWLERGPRVAVRFHHVSTDEVFGSLGPLDCAFSERTPYAPNSPYAASKAASDHLVRAYNKTYGLPVTISNCSNNYGPLHFPEKFIPLLITNALQGKKLPVYGDGRNVREWVHVTDHCMGIELVLKRGVEGESYNIGGGLELSNLEVLHAVCTNVDELLLGNREWQERFPHAAVVSGGRSIDLVEFVTDRKGHDFRYAIDGGKAERELGYRAQVGFESGIRATVRWYVTNPKWWQSVALKLEVSK